MIRSPNATQRCSDTSIRRWMTLNTDMLMRDREDSRIQTDFKGIRLAERELLRNKRRLQICFQDNMGFFGVTVANSWLRKQM